MENLKDELRNYENFIRNNAGKAADDIPEGYFQQMQREVMDTIKDQPVENHASKVIFLGLSKRALSIAASVAILLIIATLWLMPKGSSEANEMYAVNEDVALEYLAERTSEQDIEWMIDEGVLLDEDISELESEMTYKEIVEEMIEEDPTYAYELLNI